MTIRFEDLIMNDFILLSNKQTNNWQVVALVQENIESKSIKVYNLNIKGRSLERTQSIPALKVPLESKKILLDGKINIFMFVDMNSGSFALLGSNAISYCRTLPNSILIVSCRSFSFNDIIE